MLKLVLGLGLLMALSLFSEGCSKDPAADQQTDRPANAANTNKPDQSELAPAAQPTLKGDIERVSLAISIARDAVKQNRAAEAVSQLQFAKKQIDSALGRNPRLVGEFEALKVAIDRTIPAVENHEKEADGRLGDLQTRIGAIKMNTY